jgi:hypothetical protein
VLGLVTVVSLGVLLATGNDPLWALPIVLPLGAAITVVVEVRGGRADRERAED